MKYDIFLGIVGTVGGVIATYMGGWDTALQALLIFMAVDYITGLVVAGVFKTSTKTDSGALESRAGFKGLLRKGGILLVVVVACQVDMLIGSNLARDAVVIAFCINEALSIIENMGLMGVPIPDVLTKAIDVLKEKETEEN
ncbi:phage holin family protein [Eubacterium barkeri]|uniref:Toxin secretion/phage lysis holin n=1 Tax=Eubacterium barkeri TaxID=1528 RepID=A0A1H3HCF5_EUBBA|nr:phage holin family protein [Eubacterium barkeri]SDY12915.1 toxin secretion/phage lysis holin [Eubacterium barkeri]